MDNKVCKTCQIFKSFKSFRVSKKTGKLLNPCFECRQSAKIAYNASHISLNNKAKGLWAENNKEKVHKARKKWKEANIGKVKADKANRKARIRQATPVWLTPIQKEAIEFYYMMAHLRTMTSGIKYVVDHISPIRGKNSSGLHVPWNLEVVKASDNLKKSNKIVPWALSNLRVEND